MAAEQTSSSRPPRSSGREATVRQINIGAWLAGAVLAAAFVGIWFTLEAVTSDGLAVIGTLAACVTAAAFWPRITGLAIGIVALLGD
ncbi:MAG: hypothetical protein HYX29_11775 [Solirubrobacterales bacterium]|nr:hypothetical protein [Solirubrobacterales bacterium]